MSATALDACAKYSLVVYKGYLAHKKRPPRRTLQYDHPQGPMVTLGGGLFLMSEVPLYGPLPRSVTSLQERTWN